jgi:hypothetical protein
MPPFASGLMIRTMSMYLSNADVHPVGAEITEFIDDLSTIKEFRDESDSPSAGREAKDDTTQTL